MTDQEIIADALQRHPECSYGEVVNGISAMFRFTRVARLWRNQECHDAGDPHRVDVEGYPPYDRLPLRVNHGS